MEQDVSRFVLKLRQAHPFLGSMALFAEYRFTELVESFDTDGKLIRVNPDFFSRHSDDQKAGILLHLVLHCALLHTLRMRSRDAKLWNVAADIAVNNIILEQETFPPPQGTAIDTTLAHYSAEQIYELLARSVTAPRTDGDPRQDLRPSDAPDQSRVDRELRQHWHGARHRASTLVRLHQLGRGIDPGGLERELEIALGHRVDWRTVLWRYLVRTPHDFTHFDRRFVHQGLYLEALSGESLEVDIVVDTSGSIDERDLASFLGEVRAIGRSYEHIKLRLYYVDSAVHGPYDIDRDRALPTPIGDGGTAFSAFFDATRDVDHGLEPPLCIYFTDGDGFFPSAPPKRPVLWVVTSTGVPEARFPFGDVTRLSYAYE